MAAEGAMTDERRAVLEAGGFNVDEAMKRFMNKEQLWIRFLKKFKADSSYENLVKAMAEKDSNLAIAAAHSMKVSNGNLVMTLLYSMFSV